jgi:hypothetical protein
LDDAEDERPRHSAYKQVAGDQWEADEREKDGDAR